MSITDDKEPGESPFHSGEHAVQHRVGVRAAAERGGRAMIRHEMPLQHRELFEKLPYIVVGTVDDTGAAYATMLHGRPGFVSSPDSKTLRIETGPASRDPARRGLRRNDSVAVLGIELSSRRRNRANGIISQVSENSFAVTVNESFGNCPQYISSRTPGPAPQRSLVRSISGPLSARENDDTSPACYDETAELFDLALHLVARCDTLFIASYVQMEPDKSRRIDVSHRGGKPGFVHVKTSPEGGTTLTIPDFSGNRFFMTLGNLQLNPRCGIALIDFEQGNILSVTGRAEIVWSGAQLESFVGAERLIRFTIETGVFLQNTIPSGWSPPEPAKQTARTGAW